MYNASAQGFWSEMRQQHSANFVVFEFKNRDNLQVRDVDQVAAYSREVHTAFAVITCRKRQNLALYEVVASLYKSCRMIVLVLDDLAICDLLSNREHRDLILREAYMNSIFALGERTAPTTGRTFDRTDADYPLGLRGSVKDEQKT